MSREEWPVLVSPPGKDSRDRLQVERYLTLEWPAIREKKQKPAVIEIDFSLFPKYVFSNAETVFGILTTESSNTLIFKLQEPICKEKNMKHLRNTARIVARCF